MIIPILISSFLATAPSNTPQINPQLLQQRWPAKWITHPTASTKNYGVFHFRKRFTLAGKPEQFLIHVSADNRYRLFVNGQFVCHGPARGDLAHWRFESIDIAPYLQAGENVLAAVVWNFGEFIPWAQMTHETAFILQGNTGAEAIVNTNKDWKVLQNAAYAPLPVDWRTMHTFIVVGPGDLVEAAQYPWGWETNNFDDGAWLTVRELSTGTPREMRDGGSHWMLTPRTIPFMEETLQRLPKIARANGLQAHVNVMAVLVDLVPAEQQKAFVERVLAEQNLSQCTFYYRFYLHQAMKKAGLGDRYLEMLRPWHDMLKLGLTTFAEKPEPTRSDCHAWSASPNYDLLATVCGIEPDAPGFKSVRLAPHLGSLQWVKARMPHPRGEIAVHLQRQGKIGLTGEVILPEGVNGKFLWNGKAQTLKAGKQQIVF